MLPSRTAASVAALLAFCTATANPQGSPTSRGTTLLSGSAVFSTSGGDLNEDADGSRSNVLQVSPSLLFFLRQNVALGSGFALSRSWQGDASLTAFGVGPKVMYFFAPSSPRPDAKGSVYPFVGVAALYSRQTFDHGLEETSATGFAVSFGGGLALMLGSAVGLVVEAAYQLDNLSANGESVSGDRVNVLVGLAAFLR